MKEIRLPGSLTIEMPGRRMTAEQLRAQTQQVHTDFVSADLDIALTFVVLARTELDHGEMERARHLVSKARRAADFTGAHIDKASRPNREKLKAKREKLLDAMRQLEPRLCAS